MVQLNIQYPNLGNVLATGAYIKRQEVATEGQKARNALMQQEIQDYSENRNWLRKSRKRDETKWSQQDEDRQKRIEDEERKRIREMKKQDREDAIFRINALSKWLGDVEDVKDYAVFRDWLGKQNIMDTDMLPDPNDFMGAGGVPDEASFDQWRNQEIAKGQQKAEEIKEYTLGERQARYKGSKQIAKGAKWGEPTDKTGEDKLTPSQKAQKEAYMKEYANNLGIIKAKKTGYDPMGFELKVTDEDYEKAVQRNKELDKWFSDLGIDDDKKTRNQLLDEVIAKGKEMQRKPNQSASAPLKRQSTGTTASWRQYQ